MNLTVQVAKVSACARQLPVPLAAACYFLGPRVSKEHEKIVNLGEYLVEVIFAVGVLLSFRLGVLVGLGGWRWNRMWDRFCLGDVVFMRGKGGRHTMVTTVVYRLA